MTHKPFLLQVIEQINRNVSDGVEKTLLVLPTELSIDYFQSLYQSMYKEHGTDGIDCLTLDQCMLAESHMQETPFLILLEKLYMVFVEHCNSKETLEVFANWGSSLLEDFDCLDRYLVDASAIFEALKQQKQLTVPLKIHEITDLFRNQSMQDGEDGMNPSLFQSEETLWFWNQLLRIYQHFTKELIEQNIGYPGLCYRVAAEKDRPTTFAPYQRVIFAGFNLLTPSQHRFIQNCHKYLPLSFFWDVDAAYVAHPIHAAGYYLRKHKQDPILHVPNNIGTYLNDPHKQIFITEVTDLVTEIQHVVDVLQKEQPKVMRHKRAIVVSGRDVLVPLMDKLLAIPLHCRLDYPFKATIIYTLVEQLTRIWEPSDHETVAQKILPLLSLLYPWVDEPIQQEITALLQLIEVLPMDLEPYKGQFSLLDRVLEGLDQQLFIYISSFCTFLLRHFISTTGMVVDLYRSALQFVIDYIQPLIPIHSSGYTHAFLLKNLTESRFCFQQNNPFIGLYIVDIAEAHALDFEQIFFINMCEDVFRSDPGMRSFFPYHIRKNFGLPIVDKMRERVISYGFYRLLQRSQYNYCSYATLNTNGPPREISRLLLQLHYDSALHVIEQTTSCSISESTMPLITIAKNEKVMQLLSRFLVEEKEAASSLGPLRHSYKRSLSPSALLTYIGCPLQFYFTYVLRLKVPAPHKESNSLQLGKLFHDIMERLYKPLVGTEINKKVIMALRLKVKSTIQEAINQYHEQSSHPLNDPVLLTALLEKFVDKLLALDTKNAPFFLIGVEVEKSISFALDQKLSVRLGGIMDRIDRQAGIIRIIDYKTGKCQTTLSNMDNLWDSHQIQNHKAVLQMLYYGWLCKHRREVALQSPIAPYLINISELFSTTYKPGVFIKNDKQRYEKIEDITPYQAAFQNKLQEVLINLFDTNLPFTQTKNLNLCRQCPYVTICQRESVG